MRQSINVELGREMRLQFASANPGSRSGIRMPRDPIFTHTTCPGCDIEIIMSKEGVVENMQEDEAAFEGWCFAIRRWSRYKNIALTWEAPTNRMDCHYQRFLYRVQKMSSWYDWFHLSDEMALIFTRDSRIKESEHYVLNLPGRPSKCTYNPNLTLEEMNENKLEWFIYKNPEKLKQLLQAKTIHRQLPIGLFDSIVKTKSKIFPGGNGDMDLWGLNHDHSVLLIFELKRFCGNRRLGIISELLFYTMLMTDVIQPNPRFHYSDPIIKFEDRGTTYIPFIKSAKAVRAYMLASKFHPMIDKKYIMDIHGIRSDIKVPFSLGGILISKDYNFRMYGAS